MCIASIKKRRQCAQNWTFDNAGNTVIFVIESQVAGTQNHLKTPGMAELGLPGWVVTDTPNSWQICKCYSIKFWKVFMHLIYLKLVLWLLMMFWNVKQPISLVFYTNSISRPKILKPVHSVTQKDTIATAILCINKHKITPRSCCLIVIMLRCIYCELFYVDQY